jgi:uncharacterized membrane protein
MTGAPTDPPLTADEEKRVLDAEVAVGSAERLVFFSDAVVAIAITLLALELPVPTGDTNAAVLHSLGDHLGEYLAFLISFAVIGSHWFGHHQLFRYLGRLGGRIGMLNMAWLLMMVVMPFVTRTLTPDGDTSRSNAIRFSLYAAVQALAGVLFILMGWVMRRAKLLRPNAPATLIPNATWQGGTIALMFALSIPLFWVTNYAWVLWIVGSAVMRSIRLTLRRHRRATTALS